jgi:hypothetical protein
VTSRLCWTMRWHVLSRDSASKSLNRETAHRPFWMSCRSRDLKGSPRHRCRSADLGWRPPCTDSMLGTWPTSGMVRRLNNETNLRKRSDMRSFEILGGPLFMSTASSRAVVRGILGTHTWRPCLLPAVTRLLGCGFGSTFMTKRRTEPTSTDGATPDARDSNTMGS